ncbi:MAG: DUF2490 domain-containing protein [Candidatus Omnitrophota bacterium]
MKKAFVFFMLVFVSPISAALGFDSGDFQIIHTDKVCLQINEKSSLSLEEEAALGDDAERFYYHHTEAGFACELTRWFEAEIAYRHIWEREDGRGRWEEESRPHINGKIKWQWWDIDLSDRNRFEFRFRKDKDFATRYRNEIKIKPPLRWTKMEWRPFASYEYVFDFDKGKHTCNKYKAGFSGQITKNIEFEMYYVAECSRSSDEWDTISGIQTELGFSF